MVSGIDYESITNIMTIRRRPVISRLALTALVLLVLPGRADAYIGPGAGFAVLGSFLVIFTTIVIAIASILIWPFRALWRFARGQRPPRAAITRLIFVGLDGQDPTLTDRFMKEGLLPNFSKLAKMGCYRRLKTTYPSISPVAWSSFSTGVHPARHNIFDFLDRDRRTYLPVLSSAYIGKVDRFFKLGRYLIPRHRPEIRLLRKSKPFWTILGEHRIWSTVLRVPITFPPDKFYGAELSAMCVPDLLGTQGTFLLFTTRPATGRFKEGGQRVEVERHGDQIDTAIQGPDNMFVDGNPPLTIPMALTIDRAAKRVSVRIDGTAVDLQLGVLSDWIALTFKAAPGVKIGGSRAFQVLEIDEHFSLYVSPINLDPIIRRCRFRIRATTRPTSPKESVPYSTLGLAEDTWALNESVTSDATFLQQAYDIDRERQTMFFSALDRLKRGTVVCVFDATDRIQHMFWRYLEDGHPAARGRDPGEHKHAIRELYTRNDALVGEVMNKLQQGRRPDGAVGPRVQLVPPRRQPERVAAARGLPDAEERRRWQRGMAARRRLVEDQGVLPRADRDVPERARPRGTRHRRARRGRAGAQRRDHAEAEGPARRGQERGRHPRSVRSGQALFRAVPGKRTGPDHRLQRRLSHLVGLRQRRHFRTGVRRQRQGVERRPLHRSAARPWRLLLQPLDRRRRTAHRRPRAHRASAVRHPAAGAHGREAVRGGGDGRRVSAFVAVAGVRCVARVLRAGAARRPRAAR
jgi:hypothetical protein